MSPRYFKEHICEELEDASHYLIKAIDCMSHHPEWSKTFIKLSNDEETHATDLYRMFMEMYTTTENRDRMLESMRDGIMKCFSDNMRRIEDLKATYGLMEHKAETNNYIPPKTVTAPQESSTMKAISN